MSSAQQPRILTIAGSDPSGCAGIQADIKTISALGGYAMSAVTALTSQNTRGVNEIIPQAPVFIARQIEDCIHDIGVDAIKIGMIPNEEVIPAITTFLEPGLPVVYDPVLRASSGDALGGEGMVDALRENFLPHLECITPNIPEAELLSGETIETLDDMKQVAVTFIENLGVESIVLTGGHLAGDIIHDVAAWYSTHEPHIRLEVFSHPRVEAKGSRGTGCTFSSALATEMGFGYFFADAVERAISYVRGALETSLDLGEGNGPLNHQYRVKRPE